MIFLMFELRYENIPKLSLSKPNQLVRSRRCSLTKIPIFVLDIHVFFLLLFFINNNFKFQIKFIIYKIYKSCNGRFLARRSIKVMIKAYLIWQFTIFFDINNKFAAGLNAKRMERMLVSPAAIRL